MGIARRRGANHPRWRPLKDRFWEKVEKTSKCWNWIGGTVKGGYGWIGDGNGKNKQAHRLSYEFKHGPIPKGKWVLHRCDNPACVRPSHLYLGDHHKNMQDRTKRRRHWANQRPEEFREHARRMGPMAAPSPGEKNGMARLTWKLVRQLRRRSDETRHSLAREYGMSVQAICNVLNGKTWKEKR